MEISIITINLNNLSGLQRTAKSIVEQANQSEIEWIIIDGGSTDGSVEFIKSINMTSLKWISERDSGIYNAMNKGIKMSSGRFLNFMNSGDIYQKDDVISHTLKHIASDKDIYIGSACLDNRIERPYISNDKEIVAQFIFATVNHQSVFIKRQLFDKFGFYDEDHNISSDWWHFFKSVIIGNASIEELPYVITEYDTTGLSSDKSKVNADREELLNILPRQKILVETYRDNLYYLNIIHANKITFFLSRIFFSVLKIFLKENQYEPIIHKRLL